MVSLQDKVHNLQRQLTELIEDAAGCRKNEAVARQQAEAVGAEILKPPLRWQAPRLQHQAGKSQRGSCTRYFLPPRGLGPPDQAVAFALPHGQGPLALLGAGAEPSSAASPPPSPKACGA